MSHKKIKKFSIILFVIVYLIMINLFSVSFASYSDDNDIGSGSYYIKNHSNNLYIKDLDYFSAILSSYSADSQERWEFIYVSNGYYNIRNTYNGRYLTAPEDSLAGSLIEQQPLSSSYIDRQLWHISKINSNENFYLIQSKSQQPYGLFLSSSSYLGMYGYDLIQDYSQNTGREKWILKHADIVTLIGISNTEDDHISPLNYSDYQFISAGNITNLIETESMTVSSVKNYMENSNAFILFTHGDWDINGSYAYLNQAETLKLRSSDIYDYNSSNCIDMGKCEMAVFAGCYTSYNSAYNLPLASIHAGADCASGFNGLVDCLDVSDWTKLFSNLYAGNYDPALAAETAADMYDLLDKIDIISTIY